MTDKEKIKLAFKELFNPHYMGIEENGELIIGFSDYDKTHIKIVATEYQIIECESEKEF